MSNATDRTGLQLRSLVKRSGELELSLADVPITPPGPNEVVVRVEASPINPSDMGLLFGMADPTTARQAGTAARPVVTARVPEQALPLLAGRVDQPMPVGNEGAGVVIEAGSSDAARSLVGKTVSAFGGGGMYAQYRTVPVDMCLPLPAGSTPADGASAFVNPLTALGMVETMRREGHTALVHTAAASNLGQMLNRLCQRDGIALINIVRKADQVELLRGMGASHVYNSESPSFTTELTDALAATGATIAFDATGGGRLANQILGCMEAALLRKATTYSRYGSFTHKQIYLYGMLDLRPTELTRSYGMAWGVGGWLLTPFLAKIGAAAAAALRQRVADELKTTFASRYTREISLAEALQLDVIAGYTQRTTGEKYLINPAKGLADR